jgi:transmembrane sensor
MKENGWNTPQGGEEERIAYLIAGYIRGTITETEHEELDRWVEASEANMRLFETITSEDQVAEAQAWFARQQAQQEHHEDVLRQIKEKAGIKHRTTGRNPLWLWAVAGVAGLILLSLYWYQHQTKTPQPIAITAQPDSAPRGIVLTLASGQKKVIDPMATGTIADGIAIKKEGLVYAENGRQATGYNTLSTPAGQLYKVMLPDGTGVWLNAESSLRYPVAFGDAERKVELRGEGYFEVAKDPQRPFSVLTGTQRVQVLGTHFNINGYGDEGVVRTTLLEGKVKVEQGLQTAVLQPGQVALTKGDEILIKSADAEKELAWRERLFIFRNATVEEVAGQVKRWYGVRIETSGKITRQVTATIKREATLEQVLAHLEETGFAHFSREGNKIVIQP